MCSGLCYLRTCVSSHLCAIGEHSTSDNFAWHALIWVIGLWETIGFKSKYHYFPYPCRTPCSWCFTADYSHQGTTSTTTTSSTTTMPDPLFGPFILTTFVQDTFIWNLGFTIDFPTYIIFHHYKPPLCMVDNDAVVISVFSFSSPVSQ